jgi:hypothetical protein
MHVHVSSDIQNIDYRLVNARRHRYSLGSTDRAAMTAHQRWLSENHLSPTLKAMKEEVAASFGLLALGAHLVLTTTESAAVRQCARKSQFLGMSHSAGLSAEISQRCFMCRSRQSVERLHRQLGET